MDVDFGDMGGGGGGGGGNSGEAPDITSDLLQKFSCMNTNDHDVLIQQFKVVLGEKCLETNAEFWLDMNNWNLQAAVCAYFDYESQNSNYLLKLPSLKFVSHSSLNSNFSEEMPPNHSFVYHCLVENSGDQPWPLGCSVRFAGGTQMANEERVLLPCLLPGQRAELKLLMVTPEATGFHQSQWRPATITGQFFGETLFIIINVTNDMIDNVTQRMSTAHLIEFSTCSALPCESYPWNYNQMSESTATQMSMGPSLDQQQQQQQQQQQIHSSAIATTNHLNHHLHHSHQSSLNNQLSLIPIALPAPPGVSPQSSNINSIDTTTNCDPNIDDSMS